MTETIFMIHGMWGGPWYWENYRSVFEAHGYRCIATTLPYHDMDPAGVPDPRLATASLLDYVDALAQEIGQLDEKPIVMGHSMGGLLAQMLAERGLAKALVLLTPAAPAGILALRPSVICSFASMIALWGFWRKSLRPTLGDAVYSTLHLLPPDQQKQAYARLVPESGRVVFETGFWLFDSKHATRVDEARVTCPVLVVAGSLDRITPAAVVRQVANKYRHVSSYKEFENHAHWVVAEPGWQDVAAYVGGWLTQKGMAA